MDDLEKCHESLSVGVQSELKKEMGMLQKRILMDTVRILCCLLIFVRAWYADEPASTITTQICELTNAQSVHYFVHLPYISSLVQNHSAWKRTFHRCRISSSLRDFSSAQEAFHAASLVQW